MPLVVRLEGTNVEEGKKIISESGLNVIPADDLDDAAQKIVKAVRAEAMQQLLLYVGNPRRKSYKVPEPIPGAVASYMYDGSYPEWKKLKVGSSVYLLGMKSSKYEGLIGRAKCLVIDDLNISGDKDFDRFITVEHELVATKPITSDVMAKFFPQLGPLMNESSITHLKFVVLTDEQSSAFDQVLSEKN